MMTGGQLVVPFRVRLLGRVSFWPRRLVRSGAESTTGELFEPLRRTEERGDTENQQFPNFQNYARCEKDLKDNKHDSLHLGLKYARIFVLGHYLFLEA